MDNPKDSFLKDFGKCTVIVAFIITLPIIMYIIFYAFIIIAFGGSGRVKFLKKFLHCSRHHVMKMQGLIKGSSNLDLGSSNGIGGSNGPKGPNPNCNNNSSNTGVPHGDDSDDSFDSADLQVERNISTDGGTFRTSHRESLVVGNILNPPLPLNVEAPGELELPGTPEAVEDFSGPSDDSNDSFDSAELRVERNISPGGGNFHPLYRGSDAINISRVNMGEGSSASELIPNIPVSVRSSHNLGIPSISEFSRFIDSINLGINPEDMQVEGLSSLGDRVLESLHGTSNDPMDTSFDSMPSLEEISSLEARPTSSSTPVPSSSDSLPSLEELPISKSLTPPSSDNMEE